MELLAALDRELKALDERRLYRRRRTVDTRCSSHMRADGRAMLAFCSNDYLGLAAHPRVIDALRDGATRFGAGSGASHLISGHSRAHALLEERLAEFVAPHLEAPRALYFCTGYMANLGVLSALAALAASSPGGSNATIFSEALNHASLIDGARLSRAAVQVYPHRDIEALEKMLATSAAATKIVSTVSVFSMDGSLAPLPALLALCERYRAWLVVDDAHGFGVLGQNGRGVLEHYALRSPYVVYVGTLGKAAGVGGAFVAAHRTVIEWLLQKARSYIYTTAAAPALAHALLTSIDIIGSEEGAMRRANLQARIVQFKQTLRLQYWQHTHSNTAIQPVIVGENEKALHAADALYEQGFWVPAIRPPTVPLGTARLRVTLSAAHTADDVAQLADALNMLDIRQEAALI